MRNDNHMFEVSDNVEYYSPTNERWLGNTVVSAVNSDGTHCLGG